MSELNERKGGSKRWVSVVLFVFFLFLLAAVLKGMGWCVGGVCDVGVDMFLP